MSEHSCYDVIHELDPAMKETVPAGMDYLVLGGIATSALKHPRTSMLDGFVYANHEASESTSRPNGTRRDIDILVTGHMSDEQGKAVKQAAQECVDGKLTVSVFGFDEHKRGAGIGRRLAGAGGSWLSSRTIDEAGVLRYEIFPVQQQVKRESYSPWRLVTDRGLDVQVLHPVGHVLAYNMRSISGARLKDCDKVQLMRSMVFARPDFVCQAREGDFKEWNDFSSLLELARQGRLEKLNGQLIDGAGKLDISLFQLKSRLLKSLEASEFLIKLAQSGPIEKLLNVVVKAK